MIRPLTTEETDRILERFDATAPALQRQILAKLLWEAHTFKELVRSLREKQKEYAIRKYLPILREVQGLEKQVDKALLKCGYQPYPPT